MSSQTPLSDSPGSAPVSLARLLGYLQSDPENLVLRAQIFDAALAEGQFDLAQVHAAWALSRDPASLAWKHRLAVLDMALQQWDEAGLLLQNLIDEGQRDPEIAYNLAYVEFETGRFEQAVERLQPLLAMHLDRVPEALALLVRCLHRQGALDAGLALFDRYLARSTSASAFGAASLLAIDAGQLARAEAWSLCALAQDPLQHEALIAQASVLLGRRDGERALACLRPALDHHPGDGRSLSMAGMAWLLAGEFNTAQDALSQAVVVMPGHLGTWHALAWSEIARGDLDAAQRAFEQALALDRGFGESHGGLAVVLALRARRSDAETSIRRALRLNPMGLSARYAQAVLSGEARDATMFAAMAEAALAGHSDGDGRPLIEGLFSKSR